MSEASASRRVATREVSPCSFQSSEAWLACSRSCCVHFGRDEEIWVGVFEGKLDGVPIWFVDYERYFGRPLIYDDQEDCYRFGLLSKAALQVCKDEGWIPHIAHVHDWMTSLSAVFLSSMVVPGSGGGSRDCGSSAGGSAGGGGVVSPAAVGAVSGAEGGDTACESPASTGGVWLEELPPQAARTTTASNFQGRPVFCMKPHSTVTDLARLRG